MYNVARLKEKSLLWRGTTQTPDERNQRNLNLQTRFTHKNSKRQKRSPPVEQKLINPYVLKHSDHLYVFFFKILNALEKCSYLY